MYSNKKARYLIFIVSQGIYFIDSTSAVQINTDKYIKSVPFDIAICTPGDLSQRVCISQYTNSIGEWTIVYAFGKPTDTSNPKIIDYMTRSNSPPYFFGVIRNLDRSGGSNLFRCFGFANPVRACQASPNPRFFPEDVPVILKTNEASAATVLATENRTTGAPEEPISGANFINGNKFEIIAVNSIDVSSCTQRIGDEIAIRVSSTYVTKYPFGGEIGNRDALIIDEEESASSGGIIASKPTHLERYYYVRGYGRVKEGSSKYNPNTGRYDIFNTGASLRNIIVRPNPIPIPDIMCPLVPH